MKEIGFDIQWFGYLCVDRGIITTAICRQVANAIGDRMDLLLFAETLLANEFCFCRERLQTIINDAWHRAKTGEKPPVNIFFEELPPKAPAQDTTEADQQRQSIPLRRRVNLATSTPAPSPAPNPARGDRTSEAPAQMPAASAQTSRISPPPPGQAVISIDDKPKPDRGLPRPVIRKKLSSELGDGLAISPTISTKETIAPANASTVVTPNRPAQNTAEPAPAENEKRIQVPATSTVTLTRPPRAPTLLDLNIEAYKGKLPNFSAISRMNREELRDTMIRLLLAAQEMGASDLHLSGGASPFVRRSGQLEFLCEDLLSAADSERLNTVLLTDDQHAYFSKHQDYDFVLALDEQRRYRINLINHKDGPAGTYRLIPTRIRSLEELGFRNAKIIRNLLHYHNGLILVTGPVGSGKTTTLASLIDELNRERQDHIITVEHPIEIIQRSKSCNITQREVGRHTRSFKTALKGALREDPDVIVIGEMRDLETIEMAITASETGHLVIGTMHTANAATTLNRLLDVFPPKQQPQIRAMVAESLRGIICQRLLPNIDGGRVVACELLLNNIAVANLIREGKSHALKAVMETSAKQGMCLMDNYILGLWQAENISDQVANLNIRERSVRHRIRSQKQLGDAGAQSVQTTLPGDETPNQQKKWGLFS